MAPPNDLSIRNLNGTWVLDKTRSTDLDALFKLQGVGWIARKAIAAGIPSLKITQGSDTGSSAPSEWMLFEPALGGMLKAAPDKRSMTWTDSEYNDNLFGRLVIRGHYISGEKMADGRVRPLVEIETKDIEPDAEGILTEAIEIAMDNTDQEGTIEKAFIHDFARNVDAGWTAEQIWAVEIVDGEKMLTRRVVVKSGSSTELARVFYTYQ
ncbi:hypothetical protein BJY00DRAFT_312124 [Aspergillus carlsbadensis]|nr:hypothetical protein BJY00DRAFT_312124 [Aspergillus carlsbadensis]